MAMINAIANLADLDGDLSGKLIVGGAVVFATTQATQVPPKGFVAQRPREAASGFFGGFKKNSPKVYVYVDPKLFNPGKKRFAFLIDAYLSWGLSQRKRKGVVVIFGGIEREVGEFHIDVLVFDAGRLVDLYDKEIPERGSIAFNAAVESVIGDVRSKYSTATIVQAGPMGSFNLPGVEYIGAKPLKSVSYRPISKGMRAYGDFLIPALIGIGGLLCYICAIGIGWDKFSGAQARYDLIAADSAFKSQGGVDTSYINVMTQRRFFMDAPRRQDLLPNAALNIVRGIGAVPMVQIIEMKLPAPSVNPQTQYGFAVVPAGKTNNDLITAQREPDASLMISVPRTAASAMDQAREVMTIIANETGMSLRLANNGWKDDGKRRTYTIEGFIHG